MRGKEGSSTLTYRLKLHYKNLDWIIRTKELYNDVMLFYYQLLLEHTELLDYGNQKVMRELERLTIVSRDKREPVYLLPYDKLPVYFRRAAINASVGLVRTYYTKYMAWCQEPLMEKPVAASGFNAQPLFYKGMYKDFDGSAIMIKLWTGASWVWVKHKVSGRRIPDDAEVLSPTISVNGKKAMLHVPVKQKVLDVRTVKERVEDGERICAVSLSSSDTLAVCTILESDGSITDSCFIRGGNELKHRRKCLLGRIARRQRLSGGVRKGERNNVDLYNKLRNVTDYYSHLVSRRIVDYARGHGVKIIVFQNIEKIVPLKDKKFVDLNENDFIIQRVVRYTAYKAFADGMVVTNVRPNYTSCKCYKCRAYVKKYNGNDGVSGAYGKQYICENGHKGNAYLNTSKNIGLMFVKKARVINSGVIKDEVIKAG